MPNASSTALFARATDRSITLFWDKPETATAATQYTVLLNDNIAATTDKTHCTFADLQPQTSYDCLLCAEPERTVLASCTVSTTAEKHAIDVTAAPYGAVGDGKTMNTAALQKAVDDCGPEDLVLLPPGVYLTGALRLHSDMELYLAEGAVLQGTANPADYEPRIPSRFEGTEMECYSSLLNLGTLDHTTGPNCCNVLIRGGGKIASGGQPLALRIIEEETERLKRFLTENADLVATCENEHTIPGRVRPRLINISNCRNVRITGLKLENGASWNVHMVYSDDIVTDHCVFRSDGVWNGDGWDPDSSTNCTLFASEFYTGDDAVAIKSGKNPEGNEIGRPCSGIRVFDCCSAFGHGIVIGSEMSGGVSDVKIWDCDLERSMSGIEIKATNKRGGYVRGVEVRDCITPRVMMHSVPYNNDGVPAPHPPVLENCRFARLTLTGRMLDHDSVWNEVAPIELAGFAQPGYALRNVTFEDITITAPAPALHLQYCAGVSLQNITCQPAAPSAEPSV